MEKVDWVILIASFIAMLSAASLNKKWWALFFGIILAGYSLILAKRKGQ